LPLKVTWSIAIDQSSVNVFDHDWLCAIGASKIEFLTNPTGTKLRIPSFQVEGSKSEEVLRKTDDDPLAIDISGESTKISVGSLLLKADAKLLSRLIPLIAQHLPKGGQSGLLTFSLAQSRQCVPVSDEVLSIDFSFAVEQSDDSLAFEIPSLSGALEATERVEFLIGFSLSVHQHQEKLSVKFGSPTLHLSARDLAVIGHGLSHLLDAVGKKGKKPVKQLPIPRSITLGSGQVSIFINRDRHQTRRFLRTFLHPTAAGLMLNSSDESRFEFRVGSIEFFNPRHDNWDVLLEGFSLNFSHRGGDHQSLNVRIDDDMLLNCSPKAIRAMTKFANLVTASAPDEVLDLTEFKVVNRAGLPIVARMGVNETTVLPGATETFIGDLPILFRTDTGTVTPRMNAAPSFLSDGLIVWKKQQVVTVSSFLCFRNRLPRDLFLIRKRKKTFDFVMKIPANSVANFPYLGSLVDDFALTDSLQPARTRYPTFDIKGLDEQAKSVRVDLNKESREVILTSRFDDRHCVLNLTIESQVILKNELLKPLTLRIGQELIKVPASEKAAAPLLNASSGSVKILFAIDGSPFGRQTEIKMENGSISEIPIENSPSVAVDPGASHTNLRQC
jgi:hypothetical protein